ncbi:DUF2946 family protein [Paludibacterium paludis]|uniref:DUF2946 family protein n=1 Tax=Paludibacterium paludis TaxID=1225769 RepID=A0A918UBQ8_9NEIS|nr:DUF2946 family protein [Paludibacterium paludis]GGY27453.1 hypothetical protein GCM10011289_33600 [Paludibacterium paludis]
MDEIVLKAMAKWPNTPAVYGWLRLDARGQWWIREERLGNPAMTDFFHRNYGRDSAGRFYVQNGPQRVYVSLDVAPYVASPGESGWLTLPWSEQDRARTAYMTPDGMLFLELGGELAVVDDRCLAGVVASGLPDWDGDMRHLPAWFIPSDQEARIPLCPETLPRLLSQYGIIREPKAQISR